MGKEEVVKLQQFSGVYSRVVEYHLFEPCDSYEVWWVSHESSIDSWEWTNKYESNRTEGKDGVYMTIVGSVSERGRYGHLGAGERLITIHEILEVKPVHTDDCRRKVIKKNQP